MLPQLRLNRNYRGLATERPEPDSKKEQPHLAENVVSAIRFRPGVVDADSPWILSDTSVCDSTIDITSTYDHVFGPEATTEDVYSRVAKNVLLHVLDGVNGTILAHGPANAGKSFTMFGGDYSAGIAQFMLTEMFAAMDSKEGFEYYVSMTVFEIYKEEITDLLDPRKSGDGIKIFERETGVEIQGLNEVPVDKVESAMRWIAQGLRRKVGRPSESHTVMRIMVEAKSGMGTPHMHVGQSVLNLLDLASSDTVHGPNRVPDASLAAFVKVLRTHADAQSHAPAPYGDSLLTQLIRHSLGGNSKTVLIAAAAPEAFNVDATKRTLALATTAMKIVNRVTPNLYAMRTRKLRKSLANISQVEHQMQKLGNSRSQGQKQQLDKLRGELHELTSGIPRILLMPEGDEAESPKTKRQMRCSIMADPDGANAPQDDGTGKKYSNLNAKERYVFDETDRLRKVHDELRRSTLRSNTVPPPETRTHLSVGSGPSPTASSMSPRGLDDAQIMLRIIAERETEITELRQKLEQQEKEKPKLSDEEQRLHAELERMAAAQTKTAGAVSQTDEIERLRVQLDLERQEHARTIVSNRKKMERVRQELTREKAEKARRNLQIKFLQREVHEKKPCERSASVDELEQEIEAEIEDNKKKALQIKTLNMDMEKQKRRNQELQDRINVLLKARTMVEGQLEESERLKDSFKQKLLRAQKEGFDVGMALEEEAMGA